LLLLLLFYFGSVLNNYVTKTIVTNIKKNTFPILFQGTESISDYAISFHYVPPQKMYALEFYKQQQQQQKTKQTKLN
jgi:hypothetical protein